MDEEAFDLLAPILLCGVGMIGAECFLELLYFQLESKGGVGFCSSVPDCFQVAMGLAVASVIIAIKVEDEFVDAGVRSFSGSLAGDQLLEAILIVEGSLEYQPGGGGYVLLVEEG